MRYTTESVLLLLALNTAWPSTKTNSLVFANAKDKDSPPKSVREMKTSPLSAAITMQKADEGIARRSIFEAGDCVDFDESDKGSWASTSSEDGEVSDLPYYVVILLATPRCILIVKLCMPMLIAGHPQYQRSVVCVVVEECSYSYFASLPMRR
jgi:hypothetical protein